MAGKQKCKMLREIRRRIAEENDIPLVTEECRYKGDCKGTCPKCESELRYLEQQLEKRRSLGKKVTVSALALGLTASFAGCRPPIGNVLEGDVPYEYTETDGMVSPDDRCTPTDGGTTDPEDELVLDGDVLYVPEEEYDPAENLSPTVYGPPLTTAENADG